MKNSTLPFISAIACSALLAACGGSGSSGNSSGTGVISADTPVTITSNNYLAVAAQIPQLEDMFFYGGSNNLNGSSGFTYDNVTNGFNLPNQSLKVYGVVRDQGLRGTSSSTLTRICNGSGTLLEKIDAKNSGTSLVGSVGSFTATACKQDDLVLQGDVGVRFNDASVSLTYTNLALSKGSDSIVLNGDGTLGGAAALPNIAGTSLKTVISRSGTTLVERTLTNYNFTTANTGSADFSINGNMLLKKNGLGNLNLTLQTTQGFGVKTATTPQTGSMLISSGGKTITLSASGDSSVKIDFSDTGTSTITNSQVLTWAQLRAQQ